MVNTYLVSCNSVSLSWPICWWLLKAHIIQYKKCIATCR